MFYALTSLGHEAVMVFFVLSGFFVGGSVMKQKHKFMWSAYSISRLTRLWLVLIPAILFTYIVDQIIQTLHPEVFAGSFSNIWASGPSKENEYSRDLVTFLGNIFFQQTIVVSVFGSNSPLWSLANEFYYYFLFPVFLLLFGYFGKGNWARRLLLGAFGLTVLILLPKGFAEGFVVFCMGALISWFVNRGDVKNFSNKYLATGGGVAFMFSILLSKANISISYISHDVLIGVGFSLFLATLVNSQLHLPLLRKGSAFLADISFSLYLTHFPVVLLIASTCYGVNQIQPDAIGMLQFVGWLCSITLLAVVFWFLFERHTDQIRLKAMHLLSR